MSERDVLAALEAATVGSRELDLLVWQVFSGNPWRFIRSTYGKQEVITWDRYRASEAGNPVVSLDHFTTSLDAALTLVPPDWRVHRIQEWDQPITHECGVWSAELWNREGLGRPSIRHDRALTAPLAVCLAALRARQSHPAASEGEGR